LIAAEWPPLDRGVIVRLIGLALGAAVVLCGWAVASWLAVGTPLFPLASGNLDPSWPANGPPGGPPSVGAFMGQLATSLIDPPWALALLGSVLVCGLVLRRSRTERPLRTWGMRLEVVAVAASVLSV